MRTWLVLVAACLCACLGARGQDVQLQGPTGGNYRFKDIGGQLYAQSYISSYSYPTGTVVVTLDRPGLRYLAGSVTATDLKPNFAYQIKLTGNPSASGMSDADDATNETLGYLGRWWRISPNPANSNDADYVAHKDTPGYVFEGYAMIAFFVTDAQGNANVRFEGNNSFHVLWRTDQRTQGANDEPVTPVTIPNTTVNPACDAGVAARSYGLYDEWEPTRVVPGTLEMPTGHYRCRMFLTEESFHDTGTFAGQWAVAMSAPLEFDIPTANPPPTPPQPPPTPPTPPGQTPSRRLTIARLYAELNMARGHRDTAWVRGTLELPEGLELANLEAQANVMGATQTLVLPPNTSQEKTVQADVSLKLGAEDHAGSVKARQRLGSRKGVLSFNADRKAQ